MRKIFVSDYDGTITDRDVYSLLAERYVPAGTPDYFAQYREGRITHFEAMAAYFAFAPTKEQELEELLAASQVDPDLGRPAWPRLFTRTRDGWKTGVGSYWRSWALRPHFIRHQWAWISRPWFGTPSTSRRRWHLPAMGHLTCSQPCSFGRICVSH